MKHRFAKILGQMTYMVTRSMFRLEHGAYKASHRYSVIGETESFVTIVLYGTPENVETTFYRAGSDSLFIKVGSNLEYFKRVAA